MDTSLMSADVSERIPLLQPTLPVGTLLDLSKVASYNKPLMLRHVVRSVIKRQRATVEYLQRTGMLPAMKGKKLPDCDKQRIRDLLAFMQTADSVEIAGHAPCNQQSWGYITNQCFITGGPGFGGWGYSVYVLFRKEVDGKKLMYTHPEPFMAEQSAKFCVIPS